MQKLIIVGRVGWEGEGVDENGEEVFSFRQPDGFNDAVYEIMRYIKENAEDLKIKTNYDFKV